MKTKTHDTKTYGMQIKQHSEGEFITVNASVKKKGRSQINNLILHLEKLEKMISKLKVNQGEGKKY